MKHKSDLKRGKHHSPALQNCYNKYGLEQLEFIILEECLPEICIQREQFYLDSLCPEYNCCKFAGSTRGVKASDFQKQRAREVHKGNNYVKGRKQTLEEIIQRQKTRRENGKNQPMLNKKHSKETKEYFSKIRKGKKNPHVAERIRVEVYCENNQKSYKSIKDAIEDIWLTYQIVLHNPNISDVINGKRVHTKGFKFKRLEKGTICN